MPRLRGRAAGYRPLAQSGALELAGRQFATSTIAFAVAEGDLRLSGRSSSGAGRIYVPAVRGRQRSRASMVPSFRYLGRQTAASTISLQGGAGSGFANGYGYRRRLLVPAQSDLAAATLSNFSVPLELTLNDLKSVANGGKVRSASGWDIRVETEAAVKLDHEIDAYDPATGRLAIWIRLPSLSTAAAQRAILYYGKAGLTASEEAVGGAWTGKVAVWRWPDGIDRGSNARHLTIGAGGGDADGEPYERSSDYDQIVFGAVTTYAAGADQWQMTERSDGVLLGHWGDNRGAFSTTTNRKSIGVSAISGTPGALTGTDLWMVDEVVGGTNPVNHKGLAILAVGSTVFLYYGTVTPASENRKNTRVAISTNSGASFTLHPEVIFDRDAGDRLQVIGALQLGAGYASGPTDVDREYIYVYLNDRGNLVSADLYGAPGGTGTDGGGTVYLARVKIAGTGGAPANTRARASYSFFNGVDAEEDPTWTTTAPGVPVFVNPRGMGKFFSVSWVAAISKFVAGWNYNTDQVGVAVSDAPWRGWELLHFGPLATPVAADRDTAQLFTACPVARWCSATQIGLAVSGNPADYLGTITAPLTGGPVVVTPVAVAVARNFTDTSNVSLATLAPGATSATSLSSIGTPVNAGAARSGNSINLTATQSGSVAYSVPFTILHDGTPSSAAITGTATKTPVGGSALPDGSYPTPTGSTTSVATMAALQTAYNAAGPGDRIVITADFTGTLSLSRSGSSTAPIVITGQGAGWARQQCGVRFQHTQGSKWHIVTKLKLRQNYMMGGQDNYLYRCEFTQWSSSKAFGWGNGEAGAAKVTATRCRIGWTKFYTPVAYEPHAPGKEQQRMAIRGDGGLDNTRDCWMFGIYVYDMPEKPDMGPSGYDSGQANAIEFGEGGAASAGNINMRADRIRVELCREGSGVVDIKACGVHIKDLTLANVRGRCDMRATNDTDITNLWFQNCTGGYLSSCGGKNNSINGITVRGSGGLKISAGTTVSDDFSKASGKLAAENFELDNFDCDVEVGYNYNNTYNVKAKGTKLRGKIGSHSITYSNQENSSPSTAGGTIPASTKTVTRFEVTAAMVGPDATA